MISAAIEAARCESPRPTIAPATSIAEDNNTMSCPAPNPRVCGRLPWTPPIALAQPPFDVSHGSQVLADSTTAHSATSQPGRGRRLMVARLTRRLPQAGAVTPSEPTQVEFSHQYQGKPWFADARRGLSLRQ
ncbi:hypothetical protein Mkiyose1088_06770 [Mycobacterium kiyosense]|uniref:Uncharacterized protein n=1 Tax=Mycobacterium kiyosense TaxID=2871094 RepID=A0A9P3Q577_9MYCO|nr:hypothetical protein IWGMT90018_53060 [Mycobacterium kiyosense]BDE16346.1 hypothetical protein MKCMC460_52060 [Mycobacterium sp. 20KCMC460]GLB82822.1 hypothetical protein SRL2020028_20780 [Mycobacterium kiyosense]GLC00401.1 hypothetical protein SRL2020400_09920 [Mycobacterium kiyosense]GLC07482.1 hypothetical protein SRL2020411_21280 [Mycobacterium kiyosense]